MTCRRKIWNIDYRKRAALLELILHTKSCTTLVIFVFLIYVFKPDAVCSTILYDVNYWTQVCQESKTYTTKSATNNDREIFEHAISVLAQFTALSVERFHKTAELLLIKEHRSTVNEADSLVQLTNILSKEIGVLANTYCSCLDASVETSDKPDSSSTNITTIFMEVRRIIVDRLNNGNELTLDFCFIFLNRHRTQVLIFKTLSNCWFPLYKLVLYSD